MAFERYFTIRISNWRLNYSKPKYVILVSCFIGVLFSFFNFHILILNGYEPENSTLVECGIVYSHPDLIKNWSWVN